MRRAIEWIGTHPFATGSMAILGLVGTVVGLIDVIGSADRDEKNLRSLNSIEYVTEQTAQDAAALRRETDGVTQSINGLAERIQDVENRAKEQQTAAANFIPAVIELPYDIARPKLIDVGWIPIKTRWQTIGDYEFSRWPIWKHGFEEVSACANSGRAECRFEFHNGSGTRLIIVTFGEIPNDTDEYKAFIGRPNFGSFRVNEAWLEKS